MNGTNPAYHHRWRNTEYARDGLCTHPTTKIFTRLSPDGTIYTGCDSCGDTR